MLLEWINEYSVHIYANYASYNNVAEMSLLTWKLNFTKVERNVSTVLAKLLWILSFFVSKCILIAIFYSSSLDGAFYDCVALCSYCTIRFCTNLLNLVLFLYKLGYCLFSVTIFGNKLHVFEDIWQISAHRTFMFKQIYKGRFCLSNTTHMFSCILFSEFS